MTTQIKEKRTVQAKSNSMNNQPKSNNELQAKNVDVFYGDFQAIKNISLNIAPNSITAFIGPSGCGKSTFLRQFNRMNDYIEGYKMNGQIIIGGKDIYDESVKVETLRKKVGMVFQKPTPFPKSIFENAAYGLRIQGIKDKDLIHDRVETSLKQATLLSEVKNDFDKPALSLSGGQQQRLCIARVLAVQPSILLMDEPTSALDPISTAKIEELVEELKKEYTIVMVTHNMQQAGRISDKTAFLYMGGLVEYGDTKKIFTNPDKERTENYITGRFG